mmetsp:Transcript_22520/g.53017  ORF Transcript_22520/g.53017 Transcript_22520/m.53017 type:complete len:105 (+) Transcript_22520:1104-1418(+)
MCKCSSGCNPKVVEGDHDAGQDLLVLGPRKSRSWHQPVSCCQRRFVGTSFSLTYHPWFGWVGISDGAMTEHTGKLMLSPDTMFRVYMEFFCRAMLASNAHVDAS